ncbi:protein artichoke [Lingula anatina]|uniref:Protein artichoke n=1 Tax=Lingula anatina TaxID=7574 RepID=A0A1S3J0M3_LINAN|nr:protein artichoke [Lingula anatina]XP_013403992.1 protein artichoke [Lingula anatina]XP_013403993.1 protein artichoke [Lingula anatina]XP_013403994.1 protein artichoke [Lingula anatina]XP_013403995.1 protein artichoke [Lingula anatina]XP_013403996.1 protein artichoke [Lingula anatina]XP_013403998.1 protein artichoke [Lingula anatina]XP_013403999.1 protein artichoke [Lingula anatina]XP_013404001.1 protein artichoke [Lingula anatina]|eukprot:XP_013403991.1 protein artichoke [Lingula anatina]
MLKMASSQITILMPLLTLACVATGFSLPTNSEQGCPSLCTCYKQSTVIRCEGMQMKKVPLLPSSARWVYLNNNRLNILGNFSFEGLPNLEYINLENNGLYQLDPNAFGSGLNKLKVLKLGHNLLKEIPEGFFRRSTQVTELDLSYNTFTTVPHTCMQYLTQLKILNVSYNDIYDPVLSSSFQHTTKLQYLDYSGNDIVRLAGNAFQAMLWWDAIPKYLNLSNCNIKYIDSEAFEKLYHLSQVTLSGNPGIPIGTLKDAMKRLEVASLRRLEMANMNITETAHIFSNLELSSLESLDLSHNQITTIGQRTFYFLSRLTDLDLSHNMIGAIGDMSGLTLIQRLHLSHNQISFLDESEIETINTLKELHLSHNKFTDISNAPLQELWDLILLDLSNNFLQEFEVSASLEHLEHLNVAQNGLTTLGTIPRLLQLKYLDVSGNRLSFLSSELFSRSNQIESVNFSHNAITEINQNAFLSHAPSVIDLSHNSLTRLEDFGWKDQQVKVILLNNNRIMSMSTTALHGLRWLSILDLSNNSLRDIWWENFKDLQNLKTLILSGNDLGSMLKTQNGVALLNSLRGLETLYLDKNSIDEPHEDLFYNLTSLTRLDLSQNMMENTSWKLLSRLQSITHLNLSSNNFKQFDPESFEGFGSLQSLDLSLNPFECNCDLLEFRNWLDRTSVSIEDFDKIDRYVCQSPDKWKGRPLMYFYPAVDSCGELFDKRIIFLAIGAIGLVIVLIGGLVFYRHRWRIKRRLARHQYGVIRERDNNALQLTLHQPNGNTQNGGNVWL